MKKKKGNDGVMVAAHALTIHTKGHPRDVSYPSACFSSRLSLARGMIEVLQ